MIAASPSNTHKQHGVVLIMALLIVALVTTIVVSVTWRFNLSMARNENRWHGAQARAYLEAAEMLTALGLQADYLSDQLPPEEKIDHLGEQWAQPGMPFPTDEGWVRGTLEDAHGRINLNLLVKNRNYDAQNDPPLDKFSASQKRFIRLLQLIELESGDVIDETFAIAMANNVQDWIDDDGDKVSGYDGAEGNYYESLDPPYPIANREMATVSELSMVKGMTPELYTKLLPYVAALPGANADAQMSGRSATAALMNINTMKPLLLRTLNRKDKVVPLDEDEWLVLLRARGGPIPGMAEQGIEPQPVLEIRELKDFFELADVKSILGEMGAGKEFDPTDLDVRSCYFYLNTETLVGEQIRRGKSLLFRDPAADGKTKVIRRTSANY